MIVLRNIHIRGHCTECSIIYGIANPPPPLIGGDGAHAHATYTRPFAFPPPREKSGPGYEAKKPLTEFQALSQLKKTTIVTLVTMQILLQSNDNYQYSINKKNSQHEAFDAKKKKKSLNQKNNSVMLGAKGRVHKSGLKVTVVLLHCVCGIVQH